MDDLDLPIPDIFFNEVIQPIHMLDEGSVFKICKDCDHIIRDHKKVIYQADDPKEKDIVMMKCEKCDCHDIFI